MESLEETILRINNLRNDLSAEAELKQIYESSEWFSARYEAGIALGINEKEMKSKVTLWIPEAEKNLMAVKPETRTIKIKRWEEDYGTSYYKGTSSICRLEFEDRKFNIIDQQKRLNTIRDLGMLLKKTDLMPIKSMLLKIHGGDISSNGYENVDDWGNEIKTGFKDKIVEMAGKEIGYLK